MIHFLATISDDIEMWNRVKYFLLNFPKKYKFSLVITGINKKSEFLIFKNKELEKKIKEEKIFVGKHDLFFSNTNYKNHPPVRWYIKSKCHNIVFVDMDMLFCSDIHELEENTDCLSGVIAHDSPFTLNEWKEVFKIFQIKFPNEIYFTNNTKKPCPFYLNFGFVHLSELIKTKIKNLYIFYLKKLSVLENYKNNQFLPQIALTLATIKSNIKTKVLPLKFNFPDYNHYENLYEGEFENIKLFHYFNNGSNCKNIFKFRENLTEKQKIKLNNIFNKIQKDNFLF